MNPNICARCGHSWYGRNPNIRPIRCAGCNATNWDRPAMKDKYGLDSLQVGGLKFIAWNDYTNSLEDRKKIVPAIRQRLRRRGINYNIYCSGVGVVISRIS